MRWSLANEIEDKMESFVHGIGRGILLRLTEELDPGMYVYYCTLTNHLTGCYCNQYV